MLASGEQSLILWSVAVALVLASGASRAEAQSVADRRLAILQAEDRGAPTARDVAAIVALLRSDPETTRMAVRALGRLERPSLISQVLPLLRSPRPEIRAEAANAVAQAAQGVRDLKASPATTTIGSAQAALIARLDVEAEASVRAALCEAVARLPYKSAPEVERAERAILGTAARTRTVADRLGVAKALEVFVRVHQSLRPPGAGAIEVLKSLVVEPATETELDPLRDARVRRLALESLISADAVDDVVVARALKDPDAQVRRLGVRASAAGGRGSAAVEEALHDQAAMVRIEALHAIGARDLDTACAAAMSAATDRATEVALVALDQLGACRSASPIALLERTLNDASRGAEPRGWPRAARALVALASAAPERAVAALRSFAQSPRWQLRLYAARAAALLKDRTTLDTLAADTNPNVAIAAAGRDETPRAAKATSDATPTPLDAADLRRLSGPRARVTIRELGRFDLALITAEAPATVLRFAQQAAAGSYNGQAFRVVPNAILAGIGPADIRAGTVLSTHAEAGLWPHVRGAVGIWAASDSADQAHLFINLVDNPRFDHKYTVFAQVLNGIEVIDQIVEGDVIESVEILP